MKQCCANSDYFASTWSTCTHPDQRQGDNFKMPDDGEDCELWENDGLA